MTGFRASVSGEPPPPAPGEHVLVCSLNWIGDVIMSLPSVQALQERRPDLRIHLLVKPGVAALWALHEVGGRQVLLRRGLRGLGPAVRAVRAGGFSRAYVMPRSYRAALIPFLAGIPLRIGLAGGLRDRLLTHVRPCPEDGTKRHQAWEYVALFNVPDGGALPPPRLRVPDQACAGAEESLHGLPRERWALMPGAARGPSKRWPEASFRALAGRVAEERRAGVVVMGSAAERALCATVADAAGRLGRNLAGRTDLAGWAAALQACSIAVSNDSGGMHMAAALGVPVVAVFGATDPQRTGPLQACAALLKAENVCPSRDIARHDPGAARALASIRPEQVMAAAVGLLDGSRVPSASMEEGMKPA